MILKKRFHDYLNIINMQEIMSTRDPEKKMQHIAKYRAMMKANEETKTNKSIECKLLC